MFKYLTFKNLQKLKKMLENLFELSHSYHSTMKKVKMQMQTQRRFKFPIYIFLFKYK